MENVFPTSSSVPFRPWPHRLAWALAIAVFPLIWMGGTVTTYDAGMAVPDWPTTYSYWFYPVQLGWPFGTCFSNTAIGCLAQVAGILAILLAVAIWRGDDRKWMRWVGVAIVVGVVAQGTLGGIRLGRAQRVCMGRRPRAGPNPRLHRPALFRTMRGRRRMDFAAVAAADVPCHTACWHRSRQSADRQLWRRRRSRLAAARLVRDGGHLSGDRLGRMLRRPSADARHFGVRELWGWLQSLLFGQVATWFELCVWLKVLNAGLIAIGVDMVGGRRVAAAAVPSPFGRGLG